MVEGQDKYKQAMQEVARSNESMGQSAGKLGDQVKDLSGKLGVQIPEGATKALNGIEGFSAGTIAKMGLVAAAVTAAIEVVKALYDTTIEAAAKADELATKSVVTGIDTQTLQKWQYASEFIDVSVDTMTGSMKKLTQAAYDAKNGNAAAMEAFDQLGVSVTDSSGHLRDSEDIFKDVIRALGQMDNETERNAIGLEIMGRSSQDLNTLIAAGCDELERYGEEAERVGYVLDEHQLKKLQEVDDAYQQMQLQLEATKNQLAVAFAPIAEAALKGVTAVVEQLTKAIRTMNEVTEKATQAVKNLLGLQGEQKGYGGIGSDVAGATWHDDVQAWVSAGGTIIDSSNINDFDKATGKLTRQFYYDPGWYTGDIASYGHMDEDEIRRLIGRNAAGTNNWRGGLTWVGEAGPKLVSLPRGSRIYSNQESENIAPVQNFTINVHGIQQLDELISWYEGRRVRARMA